MFLQAKAPTIAFFQKNSVIFSSSKKCRNRTSLFSICPVTHAPTREKSLIKLQNSRFRPPNLSTRCVCDPQLSFFDNAEKPLRGRLCRPLWDGKRRSLTPSLSPALFSTLRELGYQRHLSLLCSGFPLFHGCLKNCSQSFFLLWRVHIRAEPLNLSHVTNFRLSFRFAVSFFRIVFYPFW